MDAHSKKQYQSIRRYLSKDGKSGFAITKDGDFTSVFNYSKERGRLAKMLTMAVDLGGRKLDCFGGGLQNMYASFGAVAHGQVAFNKEYAPSGWDGKSEYPVVAMSLPKSVNAMIKAYDRGRTVSLSKVKQYDDYDEMLAARDREIPNTRYPAGKGGTGIAIAAGK